MDRIVRDEYYRFIFENSLDAILLTSPDGKIYRVNKAACDMFQRDEREICEIGRAGIIDKNDPRLTEALKERALKGKVRKEINFIRKNGEIFPADCTSAIFKDEDGKLWTVIIVRDISISKKVEEEAKLFANYDYLTGIYNRRALIDKLQKEISNAKQSKTELSLLMLDIDHFKQINDNKGHKCGDLVLQNLAKILSNLLRDKDILGRYGGDEFLVILPNTSNDEAYEVAENILKSIELVQTQCDLCLIKITTSIGVGTYNINTGDDCDSFIAMVDNNMYIAKKHRNQICNSN